MNRKLDKELGRLTRYYSKITIFTTQVDHGYL
jgi:hypothetical protein